MMETEPKQLNSPDEKGLFMLIGDKTTIICRPRTITRVVVQPTAHSERAKDHAPQACRAHGSDRARASPNK